MSKRKATILVLGSTHMSEEEGLGSEKRQSEIVELIEKLADFKPTKIAVEMIVEDTDFCDEKYKQYQAGDDELGMNEIYQIGFRLGSMLEHDTIYPIDWMGEAELGYGEMESWAKENQPELLDEIYGDGISPPELTESKTILEYYRELNGVDFLNKLHRIYVNTARIGDFNDYIGLKWLDWWYKRNLIMFANLTRLIDSEDERILFIVGASHSTIVTKFLEESEVCEVADPLTYLS